MVFLTQKIPNENEAVLIPAPQPLPEPNTHKELKGIGGWLLLLTLGMCAFTPLVDTLQVGALFYEVNRWSEISGVAISKSWTHYQWVCWSFIGLTNLVRMSAGFGLVRSRKKKTVDWAIKALWIAGPVALLAFSLLSVPYFNLFAKAGFWAALIQSSLYAGAWSLYLRKSKRVQNTYNEE